MDNRYCSGDFEYADMVEAPRLDKESSAKRVVIGLLTAVVILVMVVALIRASNPDMTPGQIVQLEGYEGQQPPRYIFNLYSLKQQKLSDEQTASSNLSAGNTTTQAQMKPLPGKPVTVKEIDPVVVREITAVRVNPIAEQEVKVAAKSILQNHQIAAPVAQHAANPNQPINELTTEKAIPLVATADADRVASRSAAITVLPVYSVKKDNVNLRLNPSLESPVVRLLSIGQSVTVFDRGDKWVQVATNDGHGTTGYIHSSLLKLRDREN